MSNARVAVESVAGSVVLWVVDPRHTAMLELLPEDAVKIAALLSNHGLVGGNIGQVEIDARLTVTSPADLEGL